MIAGICEEGSHQALVMQLYGNGSLAAALPGTWYQNLSMLDRLKLAVQVGYLPTGCQELGTDIAHPLCKAVGHKIDRTVLSNGVVAN